MAGTTTHPEAFRKVLQREAVPWGQRSANDLHADGVEDRVGECRAGDDHGQG